MSRIEWSTRVVGIAETMMTIDPSDDFGIIESNLHAMIERAYYLNLSAVMIAHVERIPSTLLASFLSKHIEGSRFTKLWIRLKPSELIIIWDPLLRLLDYSLHIGIGR